MRFVLDNIVIVLLKLNILNVDIGYVSYVLTFETMSRFHRLGNSTVHCYREIHFSTEYVYNNDD